MKSNDSKAKRTSNGNRYEVHLPKDYPWKVLNALSTDLHDVLSKDEVALVSQIIRDRDFSAYTILTEQWGLQNFCISSNQEHISALRAKYLLASLLKKFQFDTDKDTRIAAAKTKFYAAERQCQEFNHRGYISLCYSETEKGAAMLTHTRSFLNKLLGQRPITSDVVEWSRHGPGSNLDTCKGQTSTYFKYENWPYSCTSAAIPYARFLIQTNKRWLGFLENSYRKRFGIKPWHILNQEVFWSTVLKPVPGNRITFVPKNAQTERTIAIEPTMNLMLQLGVDGFIRRRLKRWDVNLDSQAKNQLFAFQGSINPGNKSYVTLDLSMASDTLSLKLCEVLLPPEWFSYLCKLRSPSGVLGEETILYEKISSMGNGFTFALESAIFAALCYAAQKVATGYCDPRSDFSIFGDDIIVRKDVSDKVVNLLSRAGLKLNLDKSFLQGQVRESCGTDWIHGKPVRPVFFSETPKNVMGLFVDINRLRRILSLRWGLEESKTVKMMSRWIPDSCLGFEGPYSDTEFDSHIHIKYPNGPYKNGMWKYRRLITKPIELSCDDFLGRKLMHDLRQTDAPIQKWNKRATGGSRFTVYTSHSVTVGQTYSVASYWQSNYAEEPIASVS